MPDPPKSYCGGQGNFSRRCPLRHRVLIPSSFAPSNRQIEILYRRLSCYSTTPLSTIYCILCVARAARLTDKWRKTVTSLTRKLARHASRHHGWYKVQLDDKKDRQLIWTWVTIPMKMDDYRKYTTLAHINPQSPNSNGWILPCDASDKERRESERPRAKGEEREGNGPAEPVLSQ